jgi:hypothetical protein
MSTLSFKFITIWYEGGMRGNSIYRILAAHPEVYWNPKFQLSTIETIAHPLDLPEQVTAFNIVSNSSSDANLLKVVGKDIYVFAYSTYHCCCMKDDINFYKIIEAWAPSNDGTILFCCQHRKHKNLNKLPNKSFIWVYGNKNRVKWNNEYYEPCVHPFAYNLNLDALYSTDYLTFETEYYKLIAHFNLTSRLNRVRAFILLSLEREQYIKKWLK